MTGRLDRGLEEALAVDPGLVRSLARAIVDSQFPRTVADDVLLAVGLDPDEVLGDGPASSPSARRRSAVWRQQVVEAWDRQCAFCGYDGQLGLAAAGSEAAPRPVVRLRRP